MPMEPVGPMIVSWRDYVDLIVERETRVLTTTIAGMEKALILQAGELARRLDELNHAHAQALQDRNEFVKKEGYEAFRDSVSKTLSETRGRDTVVTVVVAALVSLAIAYVTRGMFHS